MWLTPFSRAASRARARLDPLNMTSTSFAARMVPMPMVRHTFGIWPFGTPQRVESASWVSSASVFGRVIDLSDEPWGRVVGSVVEGVVR